MAELGKYNLLTINRFTEFGAYLDGKEFGEILLPIRYLSKGYDKGDEIEAFIFLDNEERYIATTENVAAEVGEFAYMEIVDMNEHGAFADWGLSKDLFIPYRELKSSVDEGDSVIIYVYIDERTNRITGTTKAENYISEDALGFKEKEKVKALVYRKTNLGYLCIVENRCYGMLYENEVFEDIRIGDMRDVFIKKIRRDQKIDLSLLEPGYGKIRDFSDDLYEYLEKYKYTELHDKSDPKDINATFGVSKKIFKKAVGKLYKEKKILLRKDGIEIVV